MTPTLPHGPEERHPLGAVSFYGHLGYKEEIKYGKKRMKSTPIIEKRKRQKNHRLGTCPACKRRVRVTKDGLCYRHFGKAYYQPELRPCLGEGRKADDCDVDVLAVEEGTLL